MTEEEASMQHMIKQYIRELNNTLETLDWDVFELVTKLLVQSLEEGRQVFTMGNGGSGATASHLACDLNKGVHHASGNRFRVICLNDNLPTLMAYANDVSYSEVFRETLKNFLNPGDIVIAFSGSGNSENILNAVDYTNAHGGVSVGFSGYDGGRLARMAHHSIVAPIQDMQKSEDAHLILTHILMQVLNT